MPAPENAERYSFIREIGITILLVIVWIAFAGLAAWALFIGRMSGIPAAVLALIGGMMCHISLVAIRAIFEIAIDVREIASESSDAVIEAKRINLALSKLRPPV